MDEQPKLPHVRAGDGPCHAGSAWSPSAMWNAAGRKALRGSKEGDVRQGMRPEPHDKGHRVPTLTCPTSWPLATAVTHTSSPARQTAWLTALHTAARESLLPSPPPAAAAAASAPCASVPAMAPRSAGTGTGCLSGGKNMTVRPHRRPSTTDPPPLPPTPPSSLPHTSSQPSVIFCCHLAATMPPCPSSPSHVTPLPSPQPPCLVFHLCRASAWCSIHYSHGNNGENNTRLYTLIAHPPGLSQWVLK